MDRAATAPRETGSGGAEGRPTHDPAPAAAGDAATAGAAPPAAAIGSPTPERCASPHALPHPHAASNHALGGNDANHIRDLISREPPVNLLGDPRGDGDDDGDDDDDDVDASGSTMEPPRKRAAVLVPLFRRACDGRLSVLLTRRSLKLRHHPGEVAFAGGKRDEDDESDVATALREAHEEVGLPPERVHVLGTLGQWISKHGLCVTPVVAMLRERGEGLQPNPNEVAAIFSMPLFHFLEAPPSDSLLPSIDFEPRLSGALDVCIPWPSGAFNVWGLTAAICLRLAELCRPLLERELHVPRPPALEATDGVDGLEALDAAEADADASSKL